MAMGVLGKTMKKRIDALRLERLGREALQTPKPPNWGYLVPGRANSSAFP